MGVSSNAGSGYRGAALAVLSVATLVIQLDQSGMVLALPHLQQQMRAGGLELSWVMDAYSVTLAALVLVCGGLSDRFGRRRLFLLGLLLLAVGSLTGALAPSIGVVIGGRAVMGLGAAMFMPGTLSLLTHVFDEQDRARAIGVWGAVSSLGIIVGPVVGGALVSWHGWRAVFITNAVVAVAAAILGRLVLPESHSDHPRPLDAPGMILSAVGLTGVVYGLTRVADNTSWRSVAMPIILGIAGLVGFYARCQFARRSMVNPEIVRTWRFVIGASAAAAAMFAMIGVLLVLTDQLQLVEHLSPMRAGLALLPMALGGMAGALIAPGAARRLTPGIAVAGALLILSAACWVLAGFQPLHGYLIPAVVLTLVGVGMGAVMAVANDLVMSAGTPAESGLVSSMNDAVQEVGTSLGIAISGAVLARSFATHLGPMPARAASNGSSIGVLLANQAHNNASLTAFAAASRATALWLSLFPTFLAVVALMHRALSGSRASHAH